MKRFVTITALLLLSGCVSYEGESSPVRFSSSDGTMLAGSLVLPDNAKIPVPAVVILHGAEPAARGFVYRMQANIFLERGIAVLLYDKRGAGSSEGNYESTTYAQLVEDAVAAIAFLRRQASIDAAAIGLLGNSESGWLTPQIAERAGNMRFVVNKVGPAVSWRDTNEWEVYHEFLDESGDQALAQEKSRIIRRIWDYYVTPTPAERAEIETLLSTWSTRETSSGLPSTLREVSEAYIADISYDPTPFLERTDVPTLYLYGSEDVNVPTAECVSRLSTLRARGVPVSWHVFEGEGHELGSISVTGYRFAQGFSEITGNFAQQNLR